VVVGFLWVGRVVVEVVLVEFVVEVLERSYRGVEDVVEECFGGGVGGEVDCAGGGCGVVLDYGVELVEF